MDRARDGEPAGLAVLARRQTGGRGRDGRPWATPAGNLALSVLLRPTLPPARLPLLSLLAAVALHDALAPLIPREADGGADGTTDLRIKWPNDLLFGGAKLAGILLDAASGPDGAWAVIGLGVNLRHAPVLPDRPTASLAAHAPPSPEAMAARVLDRLGAWLGRLAADGPGPLLDAWRARGHRPGDPLVVRVGPSMQTGRFAGLAEDGSLLLDQGGRTIRIVAGEVAAGAIAGGRIDSGEG